jgi:hypothetical protein
MKCDKCGSDNTQRLEVVFHNGTSSINTQSHSVETGGIGSAFGTKLGGVITETKGTSQTVLSQMAAPPQRKPVDKVGPALLGGGGLFYYGWNNEGPMSMLFGSLIIALGVYTLYSAITYNKKWPLLYKQWQESWLCHKCGNTFHHA